MDGCDVVESDLSDRDPPTELYHTKIGNAEAMASPSDAFPR
jgi:hypothetical protein